MSIDLPVVEERPPERPPSSLVVRFGYMRNIGEFPYDGETRPGCGARVVIRTRRGTELADVLTTTCSNTGCAKAVTKEMLTDYIANSGGQDYPFTTEGRVLRLATPEDLKEHSHLEQLRPEFVSTCKAMIAELQLPMKLVDVEPLLGGEMVTFYFLSEHRVDFRVLVKQLATRFHTRIQMHQVGSRDEARLVADFETCGQHCCCRQFLKVLKPVSMGSAKIQKATLDPAKISGRCGRLKCCLRYEDTTYDELRRKLPRVGTRVRIADGVGVVEETTILTQLVKVRLDEQRVVAIANEEILERDVREMPGAALPRPQRPGEGRQGEGESRGGGNGASRRQAPPAPAGPPPSRQRPGRPAPPPAPVTPQAAEEPEQGDDEENTPPAGDQPPAGQAPQPGIGAAGRRRRRRRGRGREGRGGADPTPPAGS